MHCDPRVANGLTCAHFSSVDSVPLILRIRFTNVWKTVALIASVNVEIAREKTLALRNANTRFKQACCVDVYSQIKKFHDEFFKTKSSAVCCYYTGKVGITELDQQ